MIISLDYNITRVYKTGFYTYMKLHNNSVTKTMTLPPFALHIISEGISPLSLTFLTRYFDLQLAVANQLCSLFPSLSSSQPADPLLRPSLRNQAIIFRNNFSSNCLELFRLSHKDLLSVFAITGICSGFFRLMAPLYVS